MLSSLRYRTATRTVRLTGIVHNYRSSLFDNDLEHNSRAVAFAPHACLQRLTGQHGLCKAHTNRMEARRIVVGAVLENSARSKAKRAQAVQDWLGKAVHSRHVRINMQRIVVTGQTILRRVADSAKIAKTNDITSMACAGEVVLSSITSGSRFGTGTATEYDLPLSLKPLAPTRKAPYRIRT